jgi:hypothetical protein
VSRKCAGTGRWGGGGEGGGKDERKQNTGAGLGEKIADCIARPKTVQGIP